MPVSFAEEADLLLQVDIDAAEEDGHAAGHLRIGQRRQVHGGDDDVVIQAAELLGQLVVADAVFAVEGVPGTGYELDDFHHLSCFMFVSAMSVTTPQSSPRGDIDRSNLFA